MGSEKAVCCWTCKIRHVKCDGEPIACIQCTSRQVHCHGYGPMPLWMDGGPDEQREKQRIKNAVKKNFRKNKKLKNHRQEDQNRNKVQGQNLSTPASDGEQLQPSDVSLNADSRASTLPTLTCQPLQSQALSERSFPEPLQYDEASLLMHYLDHVFPYQYPFFVKSRWSRGWLLWLLSKNGPLYRASLGLAALHQRSWMGETDGNHLELEFHTKALRQLQDFLASFNTSELQPEDETLVEIITCGVALISFEVLRGSTTNWQPHLCAMASIAITIHGQLQLIQSPDQNSSPLFESKATTAMAFHIPVLLWMDLLACVATQERPKLPYDEWLGASCTFQLSHIMGCHNSVMKAIGDLGVLSQSTVHSLAIANLDLDEFEERRQQIEDELEDALDATLTDSIESQESLLGSLRTRDPAQIKAGGRSDEDNVTRIFAAAALAQLLVVSIEAYPASSLTRCRRAVSRTILEIKMASQTVSPRQLSWPICVVGCLADPDQRPFFEDLLNSVLSEGTGISGNCGTVLDILRACWRYRVEQPDGQWDCGRTMKEMGICALLI